MRDQDIAVFLDKLEPHRTLDEMIDRARTNKAKQGDEIWQEIIESSMRGRGFIDEVFKLPTKK